MSNSAEQSVQKSSKLNWLGRKVAFVVVSLVWVWSAAGIFSLDNFIPGPIAWTASFTIFGIVPFLFFWRGDHRSALIITVASAAILLLTLNLVSPSHERDWNTAQAVLPKAEIAGNTARIYSVRQFRYADGKVQPNYEDWIVNIQDVKKVWFGVDRFSSIRPLAHTFLSFEIGDGQPRYLAFSIETRREKRELIYSPVRGIYRNYETIYVVADEQDVLSLRSDVRQHEVQLYPLNATTDQAQQIFRDMLERVNQIVSRPEFYDTLFNNCTNNLVSHANKVMDAKINPAELSVIFPGYSDWLAYEHGMIDTNLSLIDARHNFRVDQRAKEFNGQANFSQFIRQDFQ